MASSMRKRSLRTQNGTSAYGGQSGSSKKPEVGGETVWSFDAAGGQPDWHSARNQGRGVRKTVGFVLRGDGAECGGIWALVLRKSGIFEGSEVRLTPWGEAGHPPGAGRGDARN